MSYTEATVQLLSPEGTLVDNELSAPYLDRVKGIGDDLLRDFHRQMVLVRRFDIEAGNLQASARRPRRSARRTPPVRRTTSSPPTASTSWDASAVST
jgi:hypothetical protein